jgi:hypothetical protein
VGHLIRCLEELYTIRVDWAGTKFVGFTIAHDLAGRTITISMPGYMQRAVTRFNTLLGLADNPGEHVPLYRRGRLDGQALPPDDTSPLLSPQRATRIQEITGVVLYYARVVDPTLLTACTKVASKQAHPTEKVEAAAERLLRYAAKRPEATLVFHASDMRLIIHSDASYLSESGARSRVGGMSYLGNHADDTMINGAIHRRSTIIDCIVGSAAEAEYAGLYTNGQHAEGERQILDALGYPQEATLLVTDNSCAAAIANDDVTQRRSKSMDMRFHWIRDRVRQGHFHVTWRPGNVNLADLFTKDHPTSHFLALRPFYVTGSTHRQLRGVSSKISLRHAKTSGHPNQRQNNPLPRLHSCGRTSPFFLHQHRLLVGSYCHWSTDLYSVNLSFSVSERLTRAPRGLGQR